VFSATACPPQVADLAISNENAALPVAFAPLGDGADRANDSPMTPEELRARAAVFARDAALLAGPLFEQRQTENAADQLTRASSSAASNYRAACHAQTHAAFTAKIALVSEEADEALYWLQHLRDCGFVRPDAVAPLLNEAEQLAKIFGKSSATAIAREEANRRQHRPTRRRGLRKER
jgi:four helix bundle protein